VSLTFDLLVSKSSWSHKSSLLIISFMMFNNYTIGLL